MKKLLFSIKTRPLNIILIAIVLILYFLNNNVFKVYTTGLLQRFFISYFNDLMCPLFFVSYSNLLLITVNKEMRKLHWILLLCLSAGLLWEFVAPLVKHSSVTDFFDLLCYLIGAAVYWLILTFTINGKMRTKHND